ncbi:Sec-independent protein translocase protein TatB [Chitinibacter tainanensis]|uniref:Sec-independent protein translocase protein TatB n=1 Tax=Chitinibacter tainanensis TaxID=230667 RepID=UPI002354A654|nr:Sec-independent protein translocase protein TatB [Chitinibacter tainanensis]
MFDVSFGELLVIGAVTLVVVGPEKLPKVARTAGMLFGRLQRFVTNVKSDLQREMQASELAQIQREIEAEQQQISAIMQPAQSEVAQTLEHASSALQDQPAQAPAQPAAAETPVAPVASAESATPAKAAPAAAQANTSASQSATAVATATAASAEPTSMAEPLTPAGKTSIREAEASTPDNQLDLFADLNEPTPTGADRR